MKNRRKKLIFVSDEFPKQSRRYFAFIYQNKRILIDAMDEPTINNECFSWCNFYAKVNYSVEHLPENNSSKIIPIGPSFGIKLWSPFYAGINAIKNFLITRPMKKYTHDFFANYYRQAVYRIRETQYIYEIPDDNYIFYVSSLWKRSTNTNNYRLRFINCCKDIDDIHFEGGFISRTDVPGYDQYTIDHRYNINEYIEKSKRSVLVFNTPVVGDCHGWKLAEFLALGKAIISTPFLREMPVDLVHGTHIHITDGSVDSIKNAIQIIRSDRGYRESLENNARQYYLDHLQPKYVIDRIIRLTQ